MGVLMDDVKAFEDNHLSDNDLITLISSGKYENLQVLINRYMPYIIKTANSNANKGCDVEDLIAEGVLSVFNAVKVYDSTKSKFSTFVTLCISRAMLAQLKFATADKRIPDRLLSPLEDAEDLATLNPEQAYIDKESYESFKKSIFSTLSPLEYKVLCAFLSGESYSEIAVRLGITVKAVDNSLRRIRNKIKK